jgi:hypothetical protein
MSQKPDPQVPADVARLLRAMFDAMELANENPKSAYAQEVRDDLRRHPRVRKVANGWVMVGEIERMRGAIYGKLRGALQDWHNEHQFDECHCAWCIDVKRVEAEAKESFARLPR